MNDQRRRASDRHWPARIYHWMARHICRPLVAWFRDAPRLQLLTAFWMLVLSIVVLGTALTLRTTQHDVQTGRRFAVAVVCAVESGVTQSGRALLLQNAGTGKETSLSRALERLGFPDAHTRFVQAHKEADGYVTAIANTVVNTVGAKGKGIVNKDGSLNCERLERLSDALPGGH